MRPLPLLASTLTVLSLLASTMVLAHEAGAPSEKVTVLQDEMLQNVPGKKALMIEVDYLPGQSSIAHKHEGTAMAYVVAGEIVSQVKGGKAITYKTGEYWYEPAGSEHLVSKNASSTQPARLLVFMVLSPDEKILIPLQN